MSYWARPKALGVDRREQLACLLADLATELRSDHAASVQQLLAVEADPVWPATASGAGPSGGTSNGSPVERAVTSPDRNADRARRALNDQTQLDRLARTVLLALIERSPARPVALCPQCDHPLDRRFARCQRIIDGVQCGSRAGADRTCTTCHEVQPPGRPLRQGECNACRMHRQRTGRARIAVSALARQAKDLRP